MTDRIEFPHESLGNPLVAGYSEQPDDVVLRTEFEVGAARQRRTTTQHTKRITMKFRFTKTQYAKFAGWSRLCADSGARWFWINLDSELGIVPHEARFLRTGASVWKADLLLKGDRMVAFTVEVRNPPALSTRTINLVLYHDYTAIGAQLARFDTMVHTELSQI